MRYIEGPAPSPAGGGVQLCVVVSFVVQYRHRFAIGASPWRDLFRLADEDEAQEICDTLRGEDSTNLQWRVSRRVRVRA